MPISIQLRSMIQPHASSPPYRTARTGGRGIQAAMVIAVGGEDQHRVLVLAVFPGGPGSCCCRVLVFCVWVERQHARGTGRPGPGVF